ncbi:AraC family transcriptional regulator of adaptative response / methylphosphotriester-DNA alkyltransferase methyltransferase [Paenibacillus sp. 4624]|uniref:Methylphosphotriester-DNA--protein-cysteine methyltransferase family protein n=1 Tax=Paenibacillus amylolyticus TaxID=1451 RepID=A0A5M9WYX3_PAEAM|nr:bifunctional transcriptional activator/DNA repair enzyme AdaA [Paenibacillus amylolyticus]KAA8786811.1 methylphosphotriester-DNA--protein-cysteine methyltransferase family protein [Paenibacillus amylolyticus]
MKPTQQNDELPTSIPHDYWEAIIQNDHTYDGTFFYAVQTTGIFCRPSCKSRAPKSGNVLIFRHAEQALAHKFRPCKRCKPTGERVPDQEWIHGVTEYIDKHYAEPLALDVLAAVSHGSPYHLHRVFKRITGQTPVQYIQAKRISVAQTLLIRTHLTVNEIARQVGISNPAYFISVFRKHTGYTPAYYRERHDRL